MSQNIIPDWKEKEDIYMSFNDTVPRDRGNFDMLAFLSDINDAANKHGFNLDGCGTTELFAQWFHARFNKDGTRK